MSEWTEITRLWNDFCSTFQPPLHDRMTLAQVRAAIGTTKTTIPESVAAFFSRETRRDVNTRAELLVWKENVRFLQLVCMVMHASTDYANAKPLATIKALADFVQPRFFYDLLIYINIIRNEKVLAYVQMWSYGLSTLHAHDKNIEIDETATNEQQMSAIHGYCSASLGIDDALYADVIATNPQARGILQLKTNSPF